ncbi:MAG: 23S rRNA (uracil(1939)-C(5))-methyltransferase RlmD [Clostridia bacterium]|nr:23S rRNA (uracil(1939)-C(5))-methyltransferase RlmD [Clostridia bacterium]
MELHKNDVVTLTVDACTIDGSGIGRADGMAVFLPAAAVGDTVSAHILKVKKNYAFAKVAQVIAPSPDRIPPACPVFPRCGGCAFQHIAYEAECRIKAQHVADCLQRIGGVTPAVQPLLAAPETRHYRNKAQYPLALRDGQLQIGFYAPHSHRVVHCPDCSLQPPEFAQILAVFERWIRESGVSIYDETAHAGLLRHIYLRKGAATGELMVCAVINGERLPREAALVEALQAVPGVKSILLNSNTADTNVVLGPACRTLWGADAIEDRLCGLTFRISPLSFYQVNRDQAERLYQTAADYAALTGSETLLDLYCGTGTIGLTMAHKTKRLIGVEVVPAAIEDAKINALRNGIHNAEFLCADAGEAAKTLRERGLQPDVVILDPPRKGCSPETVAQVAAFRPDRIVYVSCDPATLARDCAAFAEHGYQPVSATPVDLFPRTGHIETVVLLVKLPPDDVIKVKLDVSELPVSIHDGDATYPEIKAYVEKQFGLKVSSLYISQVKRKFGLPVADSYNKPKSEKSRQPQCPPEKEKAITEALKYFKMIP